MRLEQPLRPIVPRVRPTLTDLARVIIATALAGLLTFIGLSIGYKSFGPSILDAVRLAAFAVGMVALLSIILWYFDGDAVGYARWVVSILLVGGIAGAIFALSWTIPFSWIGPLAAWMINAYLVEEEIDLLEAGQEVMAYA